MKTKRDEKSKAAAAAAEEFAMKAMRHAEEAIRRAEAQDEQEDDGPIKCFAIFKAEGFGMLEAMSQVGGRERGGKGARRERDRATVEEQQG